MPNEKPRMTWADASPQEQAIYNAYVSVSGLALSFSYLRSADIREMIGRGLTARDVTDVLKWIRRKMELGKDGFKETSLTWRNAMNPDVMEERALLVRQWNARRLGAKPKPLVAQTDSAGVTRLLPQQPASPKIIDVREALRGLADEIKEQAG